MTALTGEGAGGAARSLDHARVEVGMSTGVFHQVVTPHEPLLTQRAGESLLPRVGPVVTG